MKGVYLFFITFFTISVASGQVAGDFRSFATGNWNSVSTWERFNGSVWVNPAPSTPTSADGAITIQNAHTVSIIANVTIDQVTVQNGGSVVIDPNLSGIAISVTINNGLGTDLSVDGSFSLQDDGFSEGSLVTVNSNALVVVTTNGSLTLNDPTLSSVTFSSGSTYQHAKNGGAVPAATWASTSTCLVTGVTGSVPTGLSQNFGNLTWDCITQSANLNLALGSVSISGNVSILNSNNGTSAFQVTMSQAANATIQISGNMNVTGLSRFATTNNAAVTLRVLGDFTYSSTSGTGSTLGGNNVATASVLEVRKNFTYSSGLLSKTGTSGTSTILFSGNTAQTYTGGGTAITTAINYQVNSGATLDLGTYNLTGTGNFTLNSGGTLRVGSADAIGALTATPASNGNIQVTGLRTYTAASNTTIVYNGTGQTLGDGFPAGVNLTVSTAGLIMDNDLTINSSNVLTLSGGASLSIGSHTLAINGTLSGSGSLIGGSSSNLTIGGGTGSLGSDLKFTGSTQLNNFTLSRPSSGTASLGSNLIVLGTFANTQGALLLNGNTLQLSGTYTNGGSITCTNTSSLIIDGAGGLAAMTFGGGSINTLILDRSGTLVTNSSLIITNLNLNEGTFNNSSAAIAMATGGTISRDVNGSMTASPTGTSFNVVYNNASALASGGTGPELPASPSTSLNNLTMQGGGTVTLNSSIIINGILSLTSGNFIAGANALDLKGNFISSASSALTASSITFSGTTTISGGTTPTFGAITVSGILTPTTSFNINGNLINNGTLNSGSATVTFGGATTLSGSSTSSFNNVTITGTLVAPTGNFNVAGIWTNNGTFTRGVASNTVTFNGTSSTIGGINATNFSGVIISGTLTSPAALNVAGHFTNNGIFTASTGTLVLNGSTGQSIQGTTNTIFNNISSSNAATVTVQTDQRLSGVLTLSAGVFNPNGHFTLLSGASGDARIATLTGGASISNTTNLTVQRYLPNTNAIRAYRYLASPVTNAVASDWKDNFPITGTFNDPSTQAEWPSFTGLAQTTPTMFVYNEAHVPTTTIGDRYESFPPNGSSSTAATLVNGRGYAGFVRQTAPITLDLTGRAAFGSIPVNVTAQSAGGNDGWNLIGNPYPSPINWQNVTIPGGVGAQIAMLDNTNNIGLGAGSYVYYTQGGAGIPASYTGTIASGQAFWIRATANATITFQEDDKEAINTPDFVRISSLSDILRIRMTGNGNADELLIQFKSDGTDLADNKYDAYKLKNNVLNFSSLSTDGFKLAINGMGDLGCSKEVSLVVDGVTPGTYALSFDELESFDQQIEIRLLDNYTGKTQRISTATKMYEFTVNSDLNTYGSNRFKVYFSQPAVNTGLELTGLNVCKDSDSQITISNSQQSVSYFATLNGNVASSSLSGDGSALTLIVPKENLINGENKIMVMAAIGGCSAIPLDKEAVILVDDIYSITSVSESKICQSGSISLTAAGAPAAGGYRWYESANATTVLSEGRGINFTTPVLTKSKTYYVSAVNSLGCEGPRKEVRAEVISYDPASIVVNGDKLKSNFAAGNQWYFNGQPIMGATGDELEVNESGTYKLVVKVEGGCETSTEKEMLVTGIIEDDDSKNFFPNPVEDVLSIHIPANGNNVPHGTLQNELGQSLGIVKFKADGSLWKAEVYFKESKPGLYMIRIINGNLIINQKVVKK